MKTTTYADLLGEAELLGVDVRERSLGSDLAGCYYDPNRLIIIDETLPDFARRCTLAHELVHARYHDRGCDPNGSKPRGEPGVKPRSDSSTRPNTRSPNACTKGIAISSPKRST